MALFGGFQQRREKKALERYLSAPSIDANEIEELKKACPDAQALLYGVLTQPPVHDRRFRALLGLQAVGVTAEMVPTVVDALHDPDDFVQEAAAKLLGTCPQYAAVVVPALIPLYEKHPPIRPLILQVLGHFGPAARAAIPLLVDGLWHPAEAVAVARCLACIGADDLDPVDAAMVSVLSDHKKPEEVAPLGARLQARLEAFLLECVPWRSVDAIPAWRRALETYAAMCERPSERLLPVLTELVEYSDWRLRGDVGAQFLEMSRAKTIAETWLAKTVKIES